MLHLIDPDTSTRSDPNGCWVVEIRHQYPDALDPDDDDDFLKDVFR